MEATFSKLGEVTPISATAKDVKDLVAGKYTTTNTIKGNEITFDITIQNDGVFVITKDGENFGSFGYVVDENNKIVLDAAIETRTFNISETTGEGDAAVTKNYVCNINKTVAVDDPYNPSKVTLEVKDVEEGKTYESTTRFAAERVVEVTPTYMKDSENRNVVTIYYDLCDYLLGEKADYIPFVAGIEECVDIIWNDENPEGYFHSISDAPEGYVDNFKTLLTSVYGYTMTSENVYVNEEVGIQIELVEEDGYQYYYFSIVE